LISAVKELIEVHEAVQETAPDYLAAYLIDPSDGGRLARTHRVLQALNADPSAGNATTCNQLCKTKAVIIESALIVSGTNLSLVGQFAATRKLAFSFDSKSPLCYPLIKPFLDDNRDLRKLGTYCLDLRSNLLCGAKTNIAFASSQFQGLLLIVIMLCGLSCEFNLDTPTKFDTPRE
jgi:hypothetical protein